MKIMKTGIVLRVLWLFLAIALLCHGLYARLSGLPAEALVPMTLGMVALSFPIGLAIVSVAGLVFMVLDQLFLAPKPPLWLYAGDLALWLSLAVGGYWQWFYLFPMLSKSYRESRHSSADLKKPREAEVES